MEEETEDKNVFQMDYSDQMARFRERESNIIDPATIDDYEASKTSVDVVGFTEDFSGLQNFLVKTGQVLGIVQDPNVTAASMKAKDIVQMYVDGKLTQAQMENFLYLNNKWRGNRLNWTTFKEMISEGKSSSLNILSLSSFVYSGIGWISGDENMKETGDFGQTITGVLQGTKDIIINSKWIGKGEILARSANQISIKGSVFPILKIAAGSVLYGTSADKLISDTEINPRANGGWDNDAWNERISVLAYGIGGALLAGSGLALLGTAGAAAPVSAILGAGSLLCFGLGYLLERI